MSKEYHWIATDAECKWCGGGMSVLTAAQQHGDGGWWAQADDLCRCDSCGRAGWVVIDDAGPDEPTAWVEQ